MAYSQFDYKLAEDSARAQRQVLWERQRQEYESRKAIAPEPPMTMTTLFKIAPVRLVQS